MMTESEHGGQWPGSLTRKDCNLMIRLRFRREIEKRYGYKVEKLCKSSEFELANRNQPGDLD